MVSRLSVAARCGVVLVVASVAALGCPAVTGAQPVRATAGADCALNLSVSTLRDRTVVSWTSVAGGFYTIQRKNIGGAWVTVGSAGDKVSSFIDRHSNPDRSGPTG